MIIQFLLLCVFVNLRVSCDLQGSVTSAGRPLEASQKGPKGPEKGMESWEGVGVDLAFV